jgi:hypothetical protein
MITTNKRYPVCAQWAVGETFLGWQFPLQPPVRYTLAKPVLVALQSRIERV